VFGRQTHTFFKFHILVFDNLNGVLVSEQSDELLDFCVSKVFADALALPCVERSEGVHVGILKLFLPFLASLVSFGYEFGGVFPKQRTPPHDLGRNCNRAPLCYDCSIREETLLLCKPKRFGDRGVESETLCQEPRKSFSFDRIRDCVLVRDVACNLLVFHFILNVLLNCRIQCHFVGEPCQGLGSGVATGNDQVQHYVSQVLTGGFLRALLEEQRHHVVAGGHLVLVRE